MLGIGLKWMVLRFRIINDDNIISTILDPTDISYV